MLALGGEVVSAQCRKRSKVEYGAGNRMDPPRTVKTGLEYELDIENEMADLELMHDAAANHVTARSSQFTSS